MYLGCFEALKKHPGAVIYEDGYFRSVHVNFPFEDPSPGYQTLHIACYHYFFQSKPCSIRVCLESFTKQQFGTSYKMIRCVSRNRTYPDHMGFGIRWLRITRMRISARNLVKSWFRENVIPDLRAEYLNPKYGLYKNEISGITRTAMYFSADHTTGECVQIRK